jgi:hypothetical protein
MPNECPAVEMRGLCVVGVGEAAEDSTTRAETEKKLFSKREDYQTFEVLRYSQVGWEKIFSHPEVGDAIIYDVKVWQVIAVPKVSSVTVRLRPSR